MFTVSTGRLDIKLPGPAQSKLEPFVVEAPVIVVVLEAQVMMPPVAEAFGTAKSPATMAVAVLVQVLGAVTVTMYEPVKLA